MSRSTWPSLRSFDGESLRKVAMPLGGIGTGTVAIGGRGDLRSWEVMNEPAKQFRPRFGFFALRVKTENGVVTARAAEGPIDTSEYEGPHGSRVGVAGMPRFRQCRFEVAYPLATVHLDDPDVPVRVRIEAFNPLVPTDADASGIPAAVLRYVCTNPTDRPVEVSLAGTLENFVGDANTAVSEERATGVFLSSRDGSLGLAVLDPAAPTLRETWPDLSWGNSLLDFWEDLCDDGDLGTGAGDVRMPVASVADRRWVAPGESTAFTFVLTWHFPNRRAWIGEVTEGIDKGRLADDIVGNHYATHYDDAWSVVRRLSGELDELERRTVDFVTAFCETDLPTVVAEAALSNLSTLRSETCFRTADGRFFGWEGLNEASGSCFGSCTHVWNYEQATAFLFGSLARSMRDTEFAHATDADGKMSFRVGLPLAERARAWTVAAADGQMGCLVKLYRDWRLSGDDEMLTRLWPHARAALEFCWLPGGWDADRDGVMEGVQHNTMDVEYYGPNPQMGGWYLAALRAAEEMSRHLGDAAFADECRRLFDSGSSWLDANLFNGSYYRHEIRPVADIADVHPGVRHPTMGAADVSDPELQLGDGCLVDQLVGQVAAHVAGLGYLLDAEHVATTLRSVASTNRLEDMHGHFNHMRTYALADESALVMAAYSEGTTRPPRPFPYFNEVMTGFEYTAAVGLAYEGELAEAERIIAAIRARYDGHRRNPFDEAECGRHYARAMASWGAVLAWTGFDYDARTGVMRFAAPEGDVTRFWSTGDAWGTCRITDGEATVDVREGKLTLSQVWVGDVRFDA